MATPHSNAFVRVRDAIIALPEDRDRARLAGLFGFMTEPHQPLGELRAVIRAIGELDDVASSGLRYGSRSMRIAGGVPRARLGSGVKPPPRRPPPTG